MLKVFSSSGLQTDYFITAQLLTCARKWNLLQMYLHEIDIWGPAVFGKYHQGEICVISTVIRQGKAKDQGAVGRWCIWCVTQSMTLINGVITYFSSLWHIWNNSNFQMCCNFQLLRFQFCKLILKFPTSFANCDDKATVGL